MTTAARDEPARFSDRIAGAPISWGVCEVPGWGPMLDADLVLGDMADLGLRATEVGPVGYLPDDPAELAQRLEPFGLRPIAAFLPVVFNPGLPVRERFRALAAAASLADAGGEILMVAPISDRRWSTAGLAGLEEAAALSEDLEGLSASISELGVEMALHPHAGSLVECADDVERLLGAAIGWCLDTGHLLIGGIDPVGFVEQLGERIVHVHLKDVDAALISAVRDGELTLLDATRRGLFRPLGDGDVNLAGVLRALSEGGYEGWLTIEQDTVLDVPDPSGARQDVSRSLAFLRDFERAST